MLAGFLLINAVLRLYAFLQSVIDWDESVYLLVSDSLLRGHLPYTAVWDHKPPGIYVLFAVAQVVFGRSVLAIRILSVLAVTATCYLLYKIGASLDSRASAGGTTGGGTSSGLLAGLLYAVFSLNNGGLAANTEIFFTPFVALAFYLFLRSSDPHCTSFSRARTYWLCGLIIGLGIQIKYHVALELLALLVLIGLRALRGQSTIRQALIGSLALLGGAGAPFLLVVAVYTSSSRAQEYLYATLVANAAYVAGAGFSLSALVEAVRIQVVENALLWSCLFVAPFYAVWQRRGAPRSETFPLAVIAWLVAGAIGACATKRLYPHYFLQLLPPLCLLSGVLLRALTRRVSPGSERALLLSLVLLPSVFQVAQPGVVRGATTVYTRYVKGVSDAGDTPARIASYLRGRLEGSASIYVVDYQPVIYFLTGAPAPTKYVLPSWLIDPSFAPLIGVDQLQELHRIMSKSPRYVLKTRDEVREQNPTFRNVREGFYVVLRDYLRDGYQFERSIDSIDLYRAHARA